MSGDLKRNRPVGGAEAPSFATNRALALQSRTLAYCCDATKPRPLSCDGAVRQPETLAAAA